MLPTRLIGLFLIVVMTISSVSISAQEAVADNPRPIYILKEGVITQWEIDQRTQIAVADLSIGLEGNTSATASSIFQIQMDNSASYLYRIDVLSADRRKRSMQNRLVQVDLKTNQQTILMERPDIYVFQPSPTGEQAFVIYMEGGERGRPIPCIFDMRTLHCEPMDFIPSPTAHYAVWLDNVTIALRASLNTQTDPGILLIESRTLKTTFIQFPNNFSFNSFAPIPGTREFIISADLYDAPPMTSVQFYTLDRDTQIVKDFVYDAAIATNVTAWSFSPDRRYLLYGGLGQLSSVALAEFETGRVIGVFSEITQTSWLTNDRLLILNGYGQPPTLSEVSALDGQIKTLIANATGITLLN